MNRKQKIEEDEDEAVGREKIIKTLFVEKTDKAVGRTFEFLNNGPIGRKKEIKEKKKQEFG